MTRLIETRTIEKGIRSYFMNNEFIANPKGLYLVYEDGNYAYCPPDMTRKRDESVKPKPEGLFQERSKTHGDSVRQFDFAHQLKHFIHQSNQLTTHEAEALDMICTKIARIICGDPHFADHWFDIAGYATLVAEDLAKKS